MIDRMSKFMRSVTALFAAVLLSFGILAVDTTIDVATDSTEQVAEAYGRRFFGFASGGHWAHCSSISTYQNDNDDCFIGHFHLKQNPRLCVSFVNGHRVWSSWGFHYVHSYTITGLSNC